ncbi:hypothetical protein CVT25_001664 [Psilocybe cyanescens]|uniref:T6SS Phospholipase effector Tle1-like catalytic domain-containing protein n=1 Tax=Psilocybe cyanescens TaxID=93625 RepID=A0A409XHK9_PSICY|nr:hypothetical protein CVT25_001664 [Psilocybe cyanescens]
MTTGMKHVCTFRHALALDELQVKLLPGDYIEAGSEENTPLLGDVKEVWFAGSHSDIGGGNVVNLETDQFGPSLRWMSYEAIKEGLKMECHQKPWKPLIPKPSMNWFYGLIKYILILKLSYKGLDDVIRWPRQSPRRILPGQLIHDSVFAEGLKKTGYEAAAVFRDEGTRWDEKSLKEKGIVEDDPYSHANKTLQSIKESNDKRVPVFDKDYGALASLSSSAIGALSITEVPDSSTILVEALKAECRRSSKAGDNKFRVATLAATLDVDESIPEPVYDSAVWSVLDKLYANEPHKWSKFKYRFDSLGISDSQIVTLLNEMATRATIIQYISSLADNDQIKFNDPIIVFFSGIATSDGSNTACIAYDYPDAEPIPVSVINDLLAHVASVRGNNIVRWLATFLTLILDCCNAAGFKGDSYASANFSSHVLLASCQGLEVSDQGVFTSNLLRVLRERGPGSGGYTCTYRDIIQGLKLPGTKKPTVLHDVTPTESYLDGRDGRLFEALQDIRACRDQGNKLNISIIRDDSPLSCDVVKQLVEQDSDILRFVGRNNEHQLLVLMRNGKAVIEIRDRDEKLKRLLMVGTSDVSIIGCILEYASHFLWHLRRSPSLETNDFHVARDITLETWRLSSVDGSYTSASSPVGDNLNQDGIIRISVANTDESSLKLGFKLTNISKSGLFVWVFAFDILDLSIDTVYKPAFVNDSRDWGNACLPAGGHLKFSNVSSGEQLTVLPAGIETSVSYLKIFISNIFVDLSFIDKVSPLHVDGQLHDYSTFPSDSSDLHDAFTTSISGTLRLRGGVSKSWPRFRPFWDTIVVPIVKRREG